MQGSVAFRAFVLGPLFCSLAGLGALLCPLIVLTNPEALSVTQTGYPTTGTGGNAACAMRLGSPPAHGPHSLLHWSCSTGTLRTVCSWYGCEHLISSHTEEVPRPPTKLRK